MWSFIGGLFSGAILGFVVIAVMSAKDPCDDDLFEKVNRIRKAAKERHVFDRHHPALEKEHGVADAQRAQVGGKAAARLLFEAVGKIFFVIAPFPRDGGQG